MKKVVSAFLVLILSIVVFLFLHFVYSKIDQEVQTDDIYSYLKYLMDVDTPAKKWLNGHLGIFFRFRYFGNINWLAIPLIIYFLLTLKTKKKWLMALGFVYTISVLLLGIRGFFWWRYQFTLYPFTIAVVMLLGWENLKDKSLIIKKSFLFLVTGLTLFNFYHYFDYYKIQWENKTEILHNKYPNQVLKYITEMERGSTEPKFLICGASHLFFYYVDKKAIPFDNPEIQEKLLVLERKFLHQFLRNVLNVKYVFSNWEFEETYKRRSIVEILDLDCQKIISDKGYQLYQLRNGLLEHELESNSFNEYKIWDYAAIKPENTSPELEVQGIRGEFNFEFNKSKGENILAVYNKKKGEEGERVIQFGYTLNNDTIEANSLHSKYVYFCVEINVPEHLINKDNYIFIQDFDGKWESSKTYFAAPRWRKYVISKRIRPQSSKIGIGLIFQPQSEKDILNIQNIKIYFLDHLI